MHRPKRENTRVSDPTDAREQWWPRVLYDSKEFESVENWYVKIENVLTVFYPDVVRLSYLESTLTQQSYKVTSFPGTTFRFPNATLTRHCKSFVSSKGRDVVSHLMHAYQLCHIYRRLGLGFHIRQFGQTNVVPFTRPLHSNKHRGATLPLQIPSSSSSCEITPSSKRRKKSGDNKPVRPKKRASSTLEPGDWTPLALRAYLLDSVDR